jgi:glutathionylspermidine synthase
VATALANQHVRTVDNRLVTTSTVKKRILRDAGLDWLRKGENKDYLSKDFVRVESYELRAFKTAAESLHRLALRAATEVAARNLWSRVGIPDHCVSLLDYSVKKEMDLHLIGRFDFAGGIERLPIKLLEYNADTCSLLPETAHVQQRHAIQESKKLNGKLPYNHLLKSIGDRLHKVMRSRPNTTPNLLLSSLGYPEDRLNEDIISLAALEADIDDQFSIGLQGVIFSPEEGIFIENSSNEFLRYDFWFKFIPWEFIAFEEPNLWNDLSQIIQKNLCTVLNPAFSMLLQSKALMAIMYELEPTNPYLLKTSAREEDFFGGQYVRKPQFGRMGENIAVYKRSRTPYYETEGDYGDFPPVYQQLAQLNEDSEGHLYQPSVFYTGEASALCFRRQDDPIIDDDAEFVGSVVE